MPAIETAMDRDGFGYFIQRHVPCSPSRPSMRMSTAHQAVGDELLNPSGRTAKPCWCSPLLQIPASLTLRSMLWRSLLRRELPRWPDHLDSARALFDHLVMPLREGRATTSGQPVSRRAARVWLGSGRNECYGQHRRRRARRIQQSVAAARASNQALANVHGPPRSILGSNQRPSIRVAF